MMMMMLLLIMMTMMLLIMKMMMLLLIMMMMITSEVSEMGDSGRGQSLMYGDADLVDGDENEDDLRELNRSKENKGAASKTPEASPRDSQQPVKEIIASIESIVGGLGSKELVSRKTEEAPSTSQDQTTSTSSNIRYLCEVNHDETEKESADIKESKEEEEENDKTLAEMSVEEETSSLDLVSSLPQDAGSQASLSLQVDPPSSSFTVGQEKMDNKDSKVGVKDKSDPEDEKESANVDKAGSPVDVDPPSSGKVQKIDVVSDRPQTATQNAAECGEKVKLFDLGATSDGEDQETEGGSKDGKSEGSQDTESERDREKFGKDLVLGKGFGQESALNLTKEQEVSGWLDKSFDIKDNPVVEQQVVGMMALMEDTDGIVDYDDVVYEDRQPLFVDGTLSSMEEFPKEKQNDKTTSLHILAGLGSGKSIEAEKKTVLDPSHPETSDLEASDGGESSSSSAGDQKQVLLFFLLLFYFYLFAGSAFRELNIGG